MPSGNARFSLWVGIRLIIGSDQDDQDDTRARGHQEKKGKAKNSKGQLCVLKPETGKRHLRGEWDTVVDGYQAVEHERCFFSYKE
jgi:hypothetical protein